jgi:hypothetical protein
VALRREVVDLLRPDFLHDANEVRRVCEIAVVQDHAPVGLVRIAVQMIDAIGVERRRAPLHAVDLVALLEQEFGEVSAVLPRDAGDQRRLAVALSAQPSPP